jgi:hypothetical protein
MKGHRKIIDMTEQLPADLVYQDAHWDAALGMIEAHEAKMVWYKVAGSILAAASLVGAIFFWTVGFETPANTLAQANLSSTTSQDLGQIDVHVRTADLNFGEELFGAKSPELTAQPSAKAISLENDNQNLASPTNRLQEDETESVNDAQYPEGSQQRDSGQNEPDNGLTHESTMIQSGHVAESDANETTTGNDALDQSIDQLIAKGDGVNLATASTDQSAGSSPDSIEPDRELVDSTTDEIQENTNGDPEGLDNNTLLAGERVMLSTEDQTTSGPVPPEQLDITTEVLDDSSAQHEEIHPAAQPEVDLISQWHGQWMVELDEIQMSQVPLALDKTPVDMKTEIPNHKLWMPRKRFNLQAMVGANLWMDYMNEAWDLHSFTFDPNTPGAENLNGQLKNELARTNVNGNQFKSTLTFGLEADYDFNKKWSIRGGLHYSSANNLRFAETFDHGVHDEFGVYESNELGIDQDIVFDLPVYTTKLQYVALPISFSRRIRNKWQVSVGAGVEYLIQGQNLLAQRIQKPVTGEVENAGASVDQRHFEVIETRGYVTGFNYLNKFASIGANYYVTESITLGANFQYGLNDMTSGSNFALSTYDRPSKFYGYLRFRIF